MAFDPSDYTACALAYRMDNVDVSGTSLADNSGNGHTGTLMGSPTTGAPGKIGQAMIFAPSSAIDAGNVCAFNGDFSISAWVKFTSGVSNLTAVAKGSSGTTRNYQIYTSSGKLRLFFRSDSGSSVQLDTTNAVNDGTWHHFVWTRNTGASTATVYMDGASNSATADSTVGANLTTADHLFVGERYSLGDGFGFDGSIDEVRIYPLALSATEVAALYAYTGASTANRLLQLRRKMFLKSA